MYIYLYLKSLAVHNSMLTGRTDAQARLLSIHAYIYKIIAAHINNESEQYIIRNDKDNESMLWMSLSIR